MHGSILSIMLDDSLADWHGEAGDETHEGMARSGKKAIALA